MDRNYAKIKVLRFIPSLLSLQESTINIIVKNIEGYSRDLFKKKISPPMRKIVFDQAMERKKEIGEEQVWAALPYLDQHKTTERFSTKDFASFFRLQRKSTGVFEACVSMEEFLQYLVEFVPNLKELEIEDPTMTYPCSEVMMFKKIRLQPLATDLLLKMENLTQVSFNGVFIKFTEFVRVCRESRNMQSIQANNIQVDMEPTNSMKNILETLDQFDHQEYDGEQYPKKIGITLKRTNDVTPHRKAKVTLLNDFFDLIPIGLMELKISACKTIDTQSERNRLLRNLRRVGGTLKTLIFKYLTPELNITLNDIFEHCRELETLELSTFFLSLEGPLASFGHLKSFTWTNPFRRQAARYGNVELHRILFAPLLEKIYITSYYILDLGDIGSLLNRIRNREILTKLTNMEICYYVDRRFPHSNEFHVLARELRSVGCHVNVSVTRG